MKKFLLLILISASIQTFATSKGYLAVLSEYDGQLTIDNQSNYQIRNNVTKKINLIAGKHRVNFSCIDLKLDTIIEIEFNKQSLLIIKLLPKNTKSSLQNNNTSFQSNSNTNFQKNLVVQSNFEINKNDFEPKNSFVKKIRIKVDTTQVLILNQTFSPKFDALLNQTLNFKNNFKFTINITSANSNEKLQKSYFMIGKKSTDTMLIKEKSEVFLEYNSLLENIGVELSIYSNLNKMLFLDFQKTDTIVELINQSSIDLITDNRAVCQLFSLNKKYNFFKVILSDTAINTTKLIQTLDNYDNNKLDEYKLAEKVIQAHNQKSYLKNQYNSTFSVKKINTSEYGTIYLNTLDNGEYSIGYTNKTSSKAKVKLFQYVIGIDLKYSF